MKKIVYVDMDGVLADFVGAAEELEGAGNEGPVDEIEGFFLDFDPLPNAIEAYHTLTEKYDVYILSTAPWAIPVLGATSCIGSINISLRPLRSA